MGLPVDIDSILINGMFTVKMLNLMNQQLYS